MRLSDHFDDREFRCRHCGRLVGPARKLVQVLENLRAIDGKPIVIVSGYRCWWWNRRVGGARLSQHVRGRAADIRPRYTVDQAVAAGATGIGHRGGFVVHVDVRRRRRHVIFEE